MRHGPFVPPDERLLWLNPTDDHGVRFLIGTARAGEEWEQGEY